MKPLQAVGFLLAAGLFVAIPALAQNSVPIGAWNMNADASGRLQSMTSVDPITQLNTEKQIFINLDQNFNPVSGTITFKDGVERPFTSPVEMQTYMDQLKGQEAIWDYLSTHADVNVTSTQPEEKVPTNLFGRETRVVTDDGMELIGTMRAGTNDVDNFALEVPDANDGLLPIYMNSISEIDQLK